MPARALAVLSAVVLGLVAAPAARAATLTATTTDDVLHGGCAPAACSLRDAVVTANASGEDDVVVLPAGTYRLALAGRGEDRAARGDLDVAPAASAGTLTLRGAGARTTTIDAAGLDRVLDVLRGAALDLSHVRLTGGVAADDEGGGAIAVVGATSSLTASDVALVGNRATTDAGGFGGGGALQTAGTTTLDRATLAGNAAAGDGGALLQQGGELAVTNATLADNRVDTALAPGRDYDAIGGAAELGGDRTTFVGVTVTGNTITDPAGATGRSPAIEADTTGPRTFADVLVAGNRASDAIAAGDPAAARACGTPLQAVPDTPADLDDDGSCFSGTGAVRATPRLGALGDHGGETDTVPLLAGSPGIDAGDAAAPATDQRGAPRVGRPDLGAFEAGATAPATPTGPTTPARPSAPGTTGRPAPTRVTLAVTPKRDRTRPFRLRASGRVVLPAGVTAARGCRGRVSLAVRRGPRSVVARTVSLRPTCRFALTLRVPARATGRLRVVATWRGNAALRPRAARAVVVRVG